MGTINSVKCDLIRDTYIVEEAGEVREAYRVHMVDLTASAGWDIGDIFNCAASAAAVPKPGDPLNAVIWPNVRCYRRTPRIVGSDGAHFTVRMESQYVLMRPSATLPIRGSTSLVQIVTQKDKNNQAITVAYGGETVRAEVTVPEIRANFSREIVHAVADPEAYAKSWVNKVNSATWRNGVARTWLCTHCDWDILDRFSSPPRFRFTFEFEYSPTGHKYTVVYKDDKGNIPSDIVEGTGIKDVLWHEEADFSATFGA